MIYGLFGDKNNCKQIYIGKTERTLKERIFEHKNSVGNKAKNVVGVHFNGPGHSLENLKIIAIEKVFNRSQEIILKRESFLISTFEAEYQGLNARK